MRVQTQSGSFKGNPTISLIRPGKEKYPFSFGAEKAAMIVASFEQIKAWSEAHPYEDRSRPADPVDKAYEDRCAEACGMTQPGQ